MTRIRFVSLFILALTLSACSARPSTGPTVPVAATTGGSSRPSETPTASFVPATATTAPTATTPPTETALPTSTITEEPTAALVPTDLSTETAVPVFTKLRGEVMVGQAVCHYGPGAPYLYKYGVYQGSNLEIIGRGPQADYMLIQAIGGNNPCWVKAEYLRIHGDVMNVQPIAPEEWRLPFSPYYQPPERYSASREGDTVTVFWSPMILRPGDDSEQLPYVVEAWVCRDGQLIFTPLGTRQTALRFTDEPGCPAPSHAYLIAAEKHGYTRRIEIPWPAAEASHPGQSVAP